MGPLGNITTVDPRGYMPAQPKQIVGSPALDFMLRMDQNIRAEESHGLAQQKGQFEQAKAVTDVANKQAFGSGLSGIVADPTLNEPQRRQKIAELAAHTGQTDITMKTQNEDYQRQTKMEAEVLDRAGKGDIQGAKYLAQQHGVNIPDEVLQDGVFTKGYSIGIKLYPDDPRQAGRFATEYKRTGGDPDAAAQTVGLPYTAPKQYAPRHQLFTVTDENNKPQVISYNQTDGTSQPTQWSSVQKSTGSGSGKKESSEEISIRLFEGAYAADYPDANSLRRAAIENYRAGKAIDPQRLRLQARKEVMNQKDMIGNPIYKTEEEINRAADEMVRYSQQKPGATSTGPLSPPAATTPGAPGAPGADQAGNGMTFMGYSPEGQAIYQAPDGTQYIDDGE